MSRQNGIKQQADRGDLAGADGRQTDGAGGRTGGHARASGETEAARRFKGTVSTGRTLPPEIRSIAAETRAEGPRARHRSFRTPYGPMQPSFSAKPRSEYPASRIQSAKSIASISPTTGPVLQAELRGDDVAKSLAILLSDLVDALKLGDRETVLVNLANRLDDRGRVAGGNAAAQLLGAVGGRLMALEA